MLELPDGNEGPVRPDLEPSTPPAHAISEEGGEIDRERQDVSRRDEENGR
jgi:hypothetical protein